MGGGASAERGSSKLLSYEDLKKVADSRNVSVRIVEAIYERFKMLDVNCDLAISQEDFQERYYLAHDVYIPAFFTSMIGNKGHVVFEDFLESMLQFEASQPLDARLGAVFDVLDINDDGLINQTDIVRMLQLLNNEVSVEQLQNVAAELTRVLPESSGSVITKRAFVTMLKVVPGMDEMITIPFFDGA